MNPKKKTIKRRVYTKERDQDIESRLTALTVDMDYVKSQVSNHIPTALARLQTSVTAIETRMTSIDAIAKFLSLVMKVAIAIGTLVFTTKKFFEKP